jgi:hypothetical protein
MAPGNADGGERRRCSWLLPLDALAADRREAAADEADGAPKAWR